MNQKQMAFISYFVLAIVAGLAIWQIFSGNTSFGIGLLVGVIIAFSAKGIKTRRINKMREQGMNPYDERTWSIAGMAAFASLRFFVVLCALIVLIGSVWGPMVKVNPYDLLGFSICVLLLLYIGNYYYYSRKF